MSEDEATEKLKRLVARCKECKFATCENCEINWNEVQAIETILNELEKKDKIIDAMAKEWFELDTLFMIRGKNIHSKEQLKQYFEEEVKDEYSR